MMPFRVGEVTVQCLKDGTAPFAEGTLDVSYPGVSIADFAPFRAPFPDTFAGDTWLVQFCGILVQTRGSNILVDTGLGRRPDPYWGVAEGQLGRSLHAAGLTVDDVDAVVLTHLHADHVGWNAREDGAPTFPRATYLVQEVDWAAFREPPLDRAFPFPYLEHDVYGLEASGRLQFVHGEHRLSDEVTIIPAYGHTPGHVAVRIDSGAERALIVGDAILHPAQVTHPEWPFVFDLDRDHAARTRRSLIDLAEREDMWLMACHFPDPHFGRVVRAGDVRSWRPADGT
jgi:glyoxylase-like metal-dependent hydrolase (beta-lactamase superfamily II)